MSRSSHQRCSIKKLFLNWMKWAEIWLCFIFIRFIFVLLYLYFIRSNRTEVFLKKVFLKISQNSQENTCTGVSFLSAASNFINEETIAQCFPKPMTIFAKSSIIDVWLGCKCASVLPTDLKLICRLSLLP